MPAFLTLLDLVLPANLHLAAPPLAEYFLPDVLLRTAEKTFENCRKDLSELQKSDEGINGVHSQGLGFGV
jgi:hypothetical protein